MPRVFIYELLDEFELNNINVEDEDVVLKCLLLCSTHCLSAEDLVNEWVAYSISNNVDKVTLDSLEPFDKKWLMKKSQSTAAQKEQPKILDINSIYDAFDDEDDDDAVDIRICSCTPVTPVSKPPADQKQQITPEKESTIKRFTGVGRTPMATMSTPKSATPRGAPGASWAGEGGDWQTDLDSLELASTHKFKFHKQAGMKPDQLISNSSCQFTSVDFVVERHRQVKNFVKEPFWTLTATHIVGDLKAEFQWKRHQLCNPLACLVLLDQCIESPEATVEVVKSAQNSKQRPQALDTVELQRLASSKLQMSAKETMQVAEKLHSQGYISCPRTETSSFPPDMDLASLVQAQTWDPNWGAFALEVLDRGPNPRNGIKSDNTHPPIHPTKYTSSLQGKEQKIYEFVVRHFLACLSQDAKGQETTVEISVAEERFVASGQRITAGNYLDVYPYDEWSAKEIPVYLIGDKFEPNSIELAEGKTTPPPLLTEPDLIALMKKHGIEMDATHEEHVETIKSCMNVVVSPDGGLVPGLGVGGEVGRGDRGRGDRGVGKREGRGREREGGKGGEVGRDEGRKPTIPCRCLKNAHLRTVRKVGPNTGRKFFKCDSCDFFQWADETPSFSQTNHSLTVVKRGPNTGRKFYGFPEPMDQSCDFFQWAQDRGAGGPGEDFWGEGGGDSTEAGPKKKRKWDVTKWHAWTKESIDLSLSCPPSGSIRLEILGPRP